MRVFFFRSSSHQCTTSGSGRQSRAGSRVRCCKTRHILHNAAKLMAACFMVRVMNQRSAVADKFRTAAATLSVNSEPPFCKYSMIWLRMRGSQKFFKCCSMPATAISLSGSELKKAPILLAILTRFCLSIITKQVFDNAVFDADEYK